MLIAGMVIGMFVLPSLFLRYKQRMHMVTAMLKAVVDSLLILILIAILLIHIIR